MADNKSCEVIGGKRMCGKTSELIRMAFREQLYILCADKRMAKIIYEQAKEMDLNIPYPITPDDLPLTNPCINRVLIDEVEMLLQRLIGKRISAMSTSYQLRDMPQLGEPGNESTSDISIALDIDCKDALTGLKAVQREAKKATAALKEFETKVKETTIKVSCPSDAKEES